MYENIITPPPRINELKLATYEAAANGEITEGEKNRLLWEIETRELSIAESAIDEELSSLNADLDYLMLEYETSTILVESGDTYVYEAKAKQIEQKSKGILSRICQAIKAMFTKLRQWLTGKKADTSESAPEKVKVPMSPKTAKAAFDKSFKNIDTILKIAGVTTITTTGAVAIGKSVQNKRLQKDVEATAGKLNQTEEELKLTKQRLATANMKADENVKQRDAARKGLRKQLDQKSDLAEKLSKELDNLRDKQETVEKSSYNHALSMYESTMKNCEKKMDEINQALSKSQLTPELTSQLKAEFTNLKKIYQMSQDGAKKILSSTNYSSVKYKANKLVGKEAPSSPNDYKKLNTFSELKYNDASFDIYQNRVMDILDKIKKDYPKSKYVKEIEDVWKKVFRTVTKANTAYIDMKTYYKHTVKTKKQHESEGQSEHPLDHVNYRILRDKRDRCDEYDDELKELIARAEEILSLCVKES